jgi:hypothetical protein
MSNYGRFDPEAVKEATRVKQQTITDLLDFMSDPKNFIKADEVTQERVAEQLARLALAPFKMTARVRHVFLGQIKALEMLGRYLKMYTDKLEVNGTVDMAKEIKEAIARAGRVYQAGGCIELNPRKNATFTLKEADAN